MAQAFDFYEMDQAVYRGPAGARYVTEILSGETWKPYAGADRIAPVVNGNKITAEEAGGPAA